VACTVLSFNSKSNLLLIVVVLCLTELHISLEGKGQKRGKMTAKEAAPKL